MLDHRGKGDHQNYNLSVLTLQLTLTGIPQANPRHSCTSDGGFERRLHNHYTLLIDPVNRTAPVNLAENRSDIGATQCRYIIHKNNFSASPLAGGASLLQTCLK